MAPRGALKLLSRLLTVRVPAVSWEAIPSSLTLATPRRYSQQSIPDFLQHTSHRLEVDFHVPQHAWIKDTYHWSCTLLKMGRFAEKPITYHDLL